MRPSLLIVDDTPANLDVLNGLLSRYRRRVATNGATALKLATADPQPNLILLDVMMPGMDGFEVCRQLQVDERTRGIPVIFVTALGDVETEARAFEVGAVDFITKPFSPVVVQARVHMHLELKAARDGLQQHNSLLERRVEERTAELHALVNRLRRSAIDTVNRLGMAAEYRDDDTGRHVLRMSRYSVAVASRLGWSADEQERLQHAAPMHDIGKVGIPDAILSKPDKLSAEEWTVMRQHAVIGARILSGSASEVIRLAETVALTHHEKWNGSGYPVGLAGEAIPQAGRIVAIADVFDALTSRRPYKPAYSVETALHIVEEGRGRHFDPAVVDAFFAEREHILGVREEFADAP